MRRLRVAIALLVDDRAAADNRSVDHRRHHLVHGAQVLDRQSCRRERHANLEPPPHGRAHRADSEGRAKKTTTISEHPRIIAISSCDLAAERADPFESRDVAIRSLQLREGRHLAAALEHQVVRWNRDYFEALGLSRLRGTIRYPEAA